MKYTPCNICMRINEIVQPWYYTILEPFSVQLEKATTKHSLTHTNSHGTQSKTIHGNRLRVESHGVNNGSECVYGRKWKFERQSQLDRIRACASPLCTVSRLQQLFTCTHIYTNGNENSAFRLLHEQLTENKYPPNKKKTHNRKT